MILRKPPADTLLDKAKDLGLITEDEFFRLKYERAKEEWENFVNKKKPKTKK